MAVRKLFAGRPCGPTDEVGPQVRLSPDDRRSLKRVLQERRAAIDPTSRGFPRRSPGPGRRAAGLSQEQMDDLLLRSRGTYNRFENGRLPRPSGDFLAAVAKILGLSEQEWTFLWRLTRKENPPRTLHSGSGMSVAGMWQQIVDRIDGAVAYVSDAEYTVIAHNAEFRRLFPPGRAPLNVMRYLLLDVRARTETLTDWETRWAPAMVPHFKQSVEARPDSLLLASLERAVLADPLVGPLYRASASVPVAYADGSELPIHHAVHGPGVLTTCLAEPVSAPGARVNLSFYTPDAPGPPVPPGRGHRP
ncbi:helix-turn-helix domain-containing protein [Streptomyces sp. NRRL F-5727]|uniref:MmyB family transcriptional regulator n=1 Tax=Streptomyces sp. NRRL F-5727 TaxID=1463871 RepID=UPI00068FC5C6|nr:helix-turn-helix domain-containing protein [Streptomyces sp. NRRL F-5727]